MLDCVIRDEWIDMLLHRWEILQKLFLIVLNKR